MIRGFVKRAVIRYAIRKCLNILHRWSEQSTDDDIVAGFRFVWQSADRCTHRNMAIGAKEIRELLGSDLTDRDDVLLAAIETAFFDPRKMN